MPADLHQGFRVNPVDLPNEAVIFGKTAAMLEVREKVECAVRGNFPVLLQGEGGTGKDLVARYLHSRSSRHEGPFVKLSCAAIPTALLEGELLGREEESSAVPNGNKSGLIDIADQGTLFLDEIGAASWVFQGKLLHLLRDGCYFRVGGREELQTSARIVCAANINLEKAAKRGIFRRDLFDRVDVMSLRLSPLRERKEDLPLLWDFFADKLAKKFSRRAPQLTPEILHVLEKRNWPGNLCELENCVARVIILGGEGAIDDFRHQTILTGEVKGIPEMHVDGTSDLGSAEAAPLEVLQDRRPNEQKTRGDLKRNYRSPLYRLRNAGVRPRPKSRTRFPRPEK